MRNVKTHNSCCNIVHNRLEQRYAANAVHVLFEKQAGASALLNMN